MRSSTVLVLGGLTLLASSGCVLAPRELQSEKARLTEAGRPYDAPIERRPLPALEPPYAWRDLLAHAFLSSGDLEAAYFTWKAAVERVDIAAGYPNSNVSVGFEYLFSNEKMKAWDRATLSLGFDPMQNLSFPSKVQAAGRVAFEEARAAAQRFEAAKFALQRNVLTSYADYALTAEKIRIHHDHAQLLGIAAESASSRVQAGAAQQGIVRAQVEAAMMEDRLRSDEAELVRMRAMLNGLIGRPPDAPLSPPPTLLDPRRLPADDALVLAIAVHNNPELTALAHQVAGKGEALERARLEYLPDINPFVGFTGGVEQVVGAAVTFATMIPQIRAAVREAQSMLRASEAQLRQARLERGASFVAALYLLRNAERQARLFEERILPLSELAVSSARQQYIAGQAGFAELIESQRTFLDVRLVIAEARTMREKQLAELEMLAGVDVETIGGAS